jgi:carbonic anhydrase
MSKTIEQLIEGYKSFYACYFDGSNPLYTQLTQIGQRPKVLVVACSDSRVDPAIVLRAEPGDLFVVRNVANLVPPYETDGTYHGTSAALEFAVCHLGITDIVIFGHTQCGGIQALLEGVKVQEQSTFSFITNWMHMAKNASEALEKEPASKDIQQKVTVCCQHAIMNSLENLKTFPWVAERLEKQTLTIHGWQFDVESGIVSRFDAEEQTFKPLLA